MADGWLGLWLLPPQSEDVLSTTRGSCFVAKCRVARLQLCLLSIFPGMHDQEAIGRQTLSLRRILHRRKNVRGSIFMN